MNKENTYKVGLIIVATNKYNAFIPDLLEGADKFFLDGHEVTYFILTDTTNEVVTEASESRKRDLVKVPHAHRKWPESTLERYHGIWEHKEVFKDQDYLFMCDADMKIVNEVGREILSDNVATIHPGHYGGRGAPETRPESLACIRTEEKLVYVCGGFSGGSKDTFLKKSQTICTNIDIDRENGIMALWYDESHANRWYLDNPPTKLLDPGYCYQESLRRPHLARIIALDKDHTEYAPERKLSSTGWI